MFFARLVFHTQFKRRPLRFCSQICLPLKHLSIALYFSPTGTNNARLAGMLRQLAMYYHKDANNLFMVRLAQVSVRL